MPLSLLLADRLIAQPTPATAVLLGACMAMMAYTSGYFVVFATVDRGGPARTDRGLDRPSPAGRGHVRAGGTHRGRARSAVADSLPPRCGRPAHGAAARRGGPLFRDLHRLPGGLGTRALRNVERGLLCQPGRHVLSGWHRGPAVADGDLVRPEGPGCLDQGRDGLRDRADRVRASRSGPKPRSTRGSTRLFRRCRVCARRHGSEASSCSRSRCWPGLGLARLRQGYGGQADKRRWPKAVAVAAVVLVNLEALRAPFEYRRWGGIPEIYSCSRTSRARWCSPRCRSIRRTRCSRTPSTC